MFDSLKHFATGVLRSWWFYVVVVPAAIAGFVGLYFPGFKLSLTPSGLLLWFIAALLFASFKTYHELRKSIPTSDYDPDVGKKLHELYYKLKPMPALDLVLLLTEIDEVLAEHFPKEQFMFGSFCRLVLPQQDQDATMDPEPIDKIRIKLREVISRYEQLQD